MENFGNHKFWQFLEGEAVNDASTSFLDDPDISLYIPYMFICGHGVNYDIGHIVYQFFKLVLYEDSSDIESTYCIYLDDLCEGISSLSSSFDRHTLHWHQQNKSSHSCHEMHTINKENIPYEWHNLVQAQYILRDLHIRLINMPAFALLSYPLVLHGQGQI